ncbi:MAG: hypothetical protein IT271_06020 [Chitinophagales bacterium]|nr:hypothetical protein [Chitinophagales bacterium]
MKNYLRSISTFMLFCLPFSVFCQLSKSDNAAKVNAGIQSVKLTLIKKSDEPNTSPEHIYLLSAKNITDKSVSLIITVSNANCGIAKSSRLSQVVYWKDLESVETLSDKSPVITIKANSTAAFYVKLSRSFNSKLNTWNCTEVKAQDADNHQLSEGLMIESFLPDPADFR